MKKVVLFVQDVRVPDVLLSCMDFTEDFHVESVADKDVPRHVKAVERPTLEPKTQITRVHSDYRGKSAKDIIHEVLAEGLPVDRSEIRRVVTGAGFHETTAYATVKRMAEKGEIRMLNDNRFRKLTEEELSA
jgi:hypothetical protein